MVPIWFFFKDKLTGHFQDEMEEWKKKIFQLIKHVFFKIQNRDYKILGTIKMDLSDVCNFKNNITIIHDGDRKKLSNDLNYFYMYNDGCQPWRDKKLFEKYIDSLDFLNNFVID